MVSREKRAALPRAPRGGDWSLRSAGPEVGQIESTPMGKREHGSCNTCSLVDSSNNRLLFGIRESVPEYLRNLNPCTFHHDLLSGELMVLPLVSIHSRHHP
eukprot:GHVR01136089.1.p1 GENE.GHVR01136089.1~~GHVR01136089.1.p1  ORF type:complete len:101 (-),score=3.04 GHVR01136089.1:732-1034(-)